MPYQIGVQPGFVDRVRKHIRYVWMFPGVMPRAAENYVRLMLGQPRLRFIEFACNFDCFAKCGHCSITKLGANHPNRPLMTVAQMQDTLRQTIELGALNINLTGGEAIMVPFLSDLVAACNPKKTVVSLATNGAPISPQKARDLARWGVRVVTMSLDSADAATHDKSRGLKGCYERLMHAIDHLTDAGIEVFLNTILTRENMINGDIYKMIELASQKRAMLTINPPFQIGGWDGADVHLDAEGKDFHRKLMAFSNVRWEGSSNYFKDGCPAGIEKLYISPYGDIMPCNFTHISFGNVTEKPLAVIWNEMLTTSPFNKIHDHCLVAENPEFYRVYIEPVVKGAVHPMPVEQHPAFSTQGN
ncbi:radical SAM protein [bacterium]|nr:radical SAM protein [bacterium]